MSGAGIALHNAADKLKSNSQGETMLYEAIKAPYKTILRNAIIDYDSNIKEGYGIDVVTGNKVNLVEKGIIDPVLVTKTALINACSVATTIMSADCVISNVREQ